MTCVTCDGVQALPSTHSLSPHNDGPTRPFAKSDNLPRRADPTAHITARIGDVLAPGAIAVLWRGMDMTAQCVEAFAGPEGVGWVEIRTMPEPGRYTLHGARYACPDCDLVDPAEEAGPDDYGCPRCGSEHAPVVTVPAHTQTVIRHGATVIVRGVELTTHPERRPDQVITVDPVGPTGDDVIRDKIQAMVDAGVIQPTDGRTVVVGDVTERVISAEVVPGREPIEMADAERDHINAVADQLRQLGWTIEPPKPAPACECVITDGAETYTSPTCPTHGAPTEET